MIHENSLEQQMVEEIRGVSESSWTRSNKKCWLNLINFGCHLLQNHLLGNIYSNPIVFSMIQKNKLCSFQGRVNGHIVMMEQCRACSNFLSDLQVNSITDPRRVCKLMDCSATVFIEEFSNFLNIFCRFAGAWLPWTFVVFSWHLTSLETWMPFKNRCPS
jgi:hypothetical protein